jgi:hypothetical protein
MKCAYREVLDGILPQSFTMVSAPGRVLDVLLRTAKRLAFESETLRAMQKAVENGIGDGGVTDPSTRVFDGKRHRRH